MLQTFGLGGKPDFAAFAVVLQHHKAFTVVRLALVVLETLQGDGTAVIHTGYHGSTLEAELHQILGVGS